MTDLARLDATAQAELVRSGQATATELVDAALARIDKVDPELNAVIHVLEDRARDQVAAGPAPGPFRGVPMLVKDLDGFLAGAPLHKGNVALARADYRAQDTSHLFRRLEEAGFVIVGKTNTPELGLTLTTEPVAKGPTRNPWNTEFSPGGSSGGSAAAVAAGLTPVAHAGDGGGSIRVPASMCGCFGLKPNRGRVSFGPGEGEDWGGLVQRHVVTRSVRDSAAILDVLAGAETGDPYTAPPPSRPYATEPGTDPGSLRIGLRTEGLGGLVDTDDACVRATEAIASTLESLGHHVEPASPAALSEGDTVLGGFTTIVFAHTHANLRWIEARVGRELTADDCEPTMWAQAELGRALSAADYIAARDTLHAWTRRMLGWWDDEGYDLLLTPTCAAEPPRLGELTASADDPLGAMTRATPYAVFTAPFNITGQPATSVPAAMSGDGVPIGVQLVAAHYREDLLLRVAAQLEEVGGGWWTDRLPPVHA